MPGFQADGGAVGGAGGGGKKTVVRRGRKVRGDGGRNGRASMAASARRMRRGSALPVEIGAGAAVARKARRSSSLPTDEIAGPAQAAAALAAPKAPPPPEYDEPPGVWRWIRHKEEEWVPGRELEPGLARYELAKSHEQVTVTADSVGPLIGRIEALNETYEDMVHLEEGALRCAGESWLRAAVLTLTRGIASQ